MKIKKGWYLVIALIACVVSLGMPVSALVTEIMGGASDGGVLVPGQTFPWISPYDVCSNAGAGEPKLIPWYEGDLIAMRIETAPGTYVLPSEITSAVVTTQADYSMYTPYSAPGAYYIPNGYNGSWIFEDVRCTNGSGNNWISSIYYHINNTAAPTPTPTPTPSPTPTAVPGYVRSTFITKSATTWNTIHGSNIMLQNTYSGVWTNSTSDADGVLYIDTLPYTTINYEATFTIFENEYASASGTVNADANGGTFIILMYPISSPPPEGYVNLFVSTMDGDNNVLRDVTVSAVWGGYQHTSSSGTYGTVQWVVPNQTQVHLTASKIGYDGADEVINTGEGPSYSTILYLEEEVVTPTPTTTTTTTYTVIPTVAVPAGAGYANAQGQNMLNWLAANGMGLVQLCFFVTILALLGVKFGK